MCIYMLILALLTMPAGSSQLMSDVLTVFGALGLQTGILNEDKLSLERDP